MLQGDSVTERPEVRRSQEEEDPRTSSGEFRALLGAGSNALCASFTSCFGPNRSGTRHRGQRSAGRLEARWGRGSGAGGTAAARPTLPDFLLEVVMSSTHPELAVSS